MTTMQYFWRHPLAQEVRGQGVEQGKIEKSVEMTLSILRWRGIEVPDHVREQLTVWSERAVHATVADDLFAGPNG
ncbi:hypothetical protein ABZ725_10820 [Streptomyces sp. NPDC006872]|uniref:hypothetical protein n=1 Tax=Streptomyces sp. NPDC006872 TaxID=3155720 RepID=UPI003411382B